MILRGQGLDIFKEKKREAAKVLLTSLKGNAYLLQREDDL
jgi:hypothetical protein